MRAESHRQAVLELPEQGLYPAVAEIGGGETERGLALQHRVRRRQEPLRLLGRLPYLFRQRAEPDDALKPLALRRLEPPLSLPALEGGARKDDLLHMPLLPLGVPANDVGERGVREPQ